MRKIHSSLFCICAKQWNQCANPWNQCANPWKQCANPWKQCVNRPWAKKIEKDIGYDIPYTVGMAELGYEYDFLNNKRVPWPKSKQ